ncbi:MAG: GntR family transcriptional regulator, partial [Alistipes sp.]|nr:GntR family transcriptional regulator [Alistipes sp.]
HIQAERILRHMINDEEYSSGAVLPNEIELARDLGISRNTLRQAINRLVAEGLLLRKKGVGTTVNTLGKASSNVRNWMSFSQEMANMGIVVRNYELHVCWEVASREVYRFFNLRNETPLLRMSRVRGSQQAPIVFFISYFNPAIGMTGDEDYTLPLYTILEQRYGIVVHKSVEEVGAMVADQELADKLFIRPGDPILRRKRLVLDKEGFPVEYNIGYYRADSFTYSIEAEK